MDYNMNSDQENQGMKDKAKQFFDRHGFYVVLIACLLILGLTAFMTFRSANESNPEALATAEPTVSPTVAPVNLAQDESLLEAQNFEPSPSLTPEPTNEPKPTQTPEQTAKPTAQETQKTPSLFPAPVEGSIINPYASDSLIFSKTLNQWTSHLGIDIAAAEGSVVKAIADGVVDSVSNDPLMGYMIRIKHNNNVESVYANLKDLPILKVGESVKTGDIIGNIGTSAISEREDESHLHFELYVDGKSIDPATRLSGFSQIP